jgi:hypothetical protein
MLSFRPTVERSFEYTPPAALDTKARLAAPDAC